MMDSWPSRVRRMLRDKTVKETCWSLAAKLTTFPLLLALSIFLARTLGVENYGTWAFFYSVLNVLLIISLFGVNSSARKFIAQHNYTPALKSVLWSSVKMRAAFSLAGAVVLLLGHSWIANAAGRPDLASLFLLAAPLLLLHGFVEFLKAAFAGLHRLKYNFIINSIEYGGKLVTTVLLLTAFRAISAVVLSYIIADALTVAVGFFLLYRKFYAPIRGSTSGQYMSDILSYSVPLFFISIAFLINTEIDTIMIGLLHGDYEVGIYAAGKEFITKLPHLSLAIAMGTMPIFAKITERNKAYLRQRFHKILGIVAVPIAGILVLLVIAAPWLIPLFYGDAYAASVPVFQVLAIYAMSTSISLLVSNLLDYTGRARRRAINLTLSVLLNVALNILLIPQYGATGAATATAVSGIPALALNWQELRQVFRPNPAPRGRS